MMQNLKIIKLNKYFNHLKVFENLDIDIPANKITCILGPSGCGKTTLLNILSGIEKFEEGDISDFQSLTFSYVFQDARLLPWKSIKNNLDFVLKKKFPKEERSQIVDKYLDMVGLKAFENYYPHGLSGGMKQRAAIARAFVYPSDVLVMDEPFKGLDIKTKKHIIEKFLDLWHEDQRTVIFVTHDIEESLMLAQKIIVLSKPPSEVSYEDTLAFPHEERGLDSPQLMNIEANINQVFFKE